MSLVLVGAWLLAVGAADLFRISGAAPDRGRRALCVLTGTGVLVAALLVVELSWLARVVLVVAGSGLLCGWLLARSAPVRAASLALGLLGAALAAGSVRGERGWAGWLDATVLGGWSTSTVLLAAGVVVAQVSTANLVVRMLLDAVGVPVTSNEKQLRGGRVLGPMERVLLVGLGALGEVTAAAVVIAAKGLLRFPELQRAHRARAAEPDGPSDVTEYFLIGSLASWLVALGGAALIRLTT